MRELKSGRSDFWEAAHDATRMILFPFNTVAGWLLGALLVLLPRTVDDVVGYGRILPVASYRLVGLALLISAGWQTWVLARRRLSSGVLTAASALLAAGAGALAFFLATSGSPLRPAFLTILWVVIVYLLMCAFWYAIVSWNGTPASADDAAIGTVSISDPARQSISAFPGPTPASFAPQATGFCVAMLTAPSERAEVIARRLVDERLAACAQVPGEMTSFYWWEGEVHRDRERMLYLKTRQDLLPAIQQILNEIHPDETPEIILLPVVGGSGAYLAWMGRELRPAETAEPQETEEKPE